MSATVTRMGRSVKGNMAAILNRQRREVMVVRFALIESGGGCDLARVPPLRGPFEAQDKPALEKTERRKKPARSGRDDSKKPSALGAFVA